MEYKGVRTCSDSTVVIPPSGLALVSLLVAAKQYSSARDRQGLGPGLGLGPELGLKLELGAELGTDPWLGLGLRPGPG